MDQVRLKETAIVLEHMLDQYKSEDDILNYMATVFAPLIQDAKDGKITTPIEFSKVPFGRIVNSGGKLRPWPDLYRAYTAFSVQLQCNESESHKTVMAIIHEIFKDGQDLG